MKDKYYICVHADSCQYTKTKRCIYGTPTSKNVLDSLCCGGIFNPQFVMTCTHPKVNNGVMLVNIDHTHIEGNYHNIWTH